MTASVERKARELFEKGAVKRAETGGRSLYFSVAGTGGSDHQVSFEPARHAWSCDCKYSSMHPDGECSHILAAKLSMKPKLSR